VHIDIDEAMPEVFGDRVGIVEVHGGNIWVESAGEEQGATCWFTLPRYRTNGRS
jgi:hypothetical protein